MAEKVMTSHLESIFKRFYGEQRKNTAISRFRFKLFSDQFRSVKDFSAFFRYFFHLFSISTGLFLVYEVISHAMGWFIVAILIALIFMVFWEWVKSIVLNEVFVGYYRSKLEREALSPTILFPFVLGIAMLVGSSWASLEGAKLLYEKNDLVKSNFHSSYQQKQDSVVQYFDNAILENTQRIKRDSLVKANFTKHGVLNWNLQITHRNLLRENIELRELKIESLKRLENDKKKIGEEVEKKSSFNQEAFAAISIVNELIILSIIFFLVYYDYRTAFEEKVLSQQEEKQTTIAHSSELIKQELSNPIKELSHQFEEPKRIGFEVQTTNHKRRDSMIKPMEYLSKYSEVVDDIEKGLTESQLLEKHSIGRSTLYNIKRTLRALHQAV